ncbi:hypothetical protein RND71_016312 [Anisodus tanguticus]|uniref:Uncharacterized protein n=1 Tax=Anisodus tanguticus TaxID=243964 RepID=A0AAE1S896_9SOLA|nr:hypothetical protein RND71_016312 [Anisodus tanguticus]
MFAISAGFTASRTYNDLKVVNILPLEDGFHPTSLKERFWLPRITYQENALTIHETIGMHTAYDHWKPILKNLSNREPDLLRTLLWAALDMIETMLSIERSELKPNLFGNLASTDAGNRLASYRIVANLKILKPLNHNDFASDGEDPSRKLSLPEAKLQELLRNCLFLSSHTNNHLMNSALVIGQMMIRNSIIRKLKKLRSLSIFDSEIGHSDSCTSSSESVLLSREENSLR